jgi:hypothetical protein
MDGEIPGPTEDISWRLRVPNETLCNAIETLMKHDIVTQNGIGIKFLNWKKRQYKRDNSTERVRRYRQKRKSETPCNGFTKHNVTPLEQIQNTETDTETDKKPPLNTPPRKPKNRVEYTTDFQTFWDVYPEKTGKGKAYEEWVKIRMSESLFSEIIDSVNKHIEHSQKWQNGYIPNPATFLHQRRWEDQPDGHKKIRSAVDIGIARFLAKGEDDE